jgi:HK97 family phage major capsid protein
MTFYNTLAKPVVEFRSMPTLLEQRNTLLDEMDGIVNKAKGETRAFSDEESTRFDEIKKEVAKIDKTLAAEEEARSFEKKKVVKKAETDEEKRALEIKEEERSFVEFVRGDTRALSAGTNAPVIPVSVANQIVEVVKNISPLLSEATIWNVKGDLSIPAYDWNSHTTAYQSELTAITASAGAFTGVTLKSFIIGSLALISKSLINRSDVDVIPFIVKSIGTSIANFLENELIQGAGTNMKGLKQIIAGQQTTTATTLVIDPAEVIKLKMKVPQSLQGKAKWLMHPNTLAYLQSLKSTTGEFLFGNTLAQDGGFTLLSKPVMLSDNCDQIGVGKFEVFYGDFSGIHVKLTNNVEMSILNERFADQYAVGALAYAEVDSVIAEPQKIVVLKGL